MIFSFANGTAQQQAWVNEAVGRCTYPLDAITTNVTVEWGPFPSNLDTKHPYMATIPSGANFNVFIAPWADDSTNVNNQGLADPAGQIHDFYLESVIHEIGHVVIDTTFNPGGADTDPRIADVCALFWTKDPKAPGGKRFGTINDWDAPQLSWADEIREAVAECFRLAFVSGVNIYTNRTNWFIDEINWPILISLMSPSAGTTTASTSIEILGLETDLPSSDAPQVELTLRAQGGPTIQSTVSVGDIGGPFININEGLDIVGFSGFPVWIHMSMDIVAGTAVTKLTRDAAGTIVIVEADFSIPTSVPTVFQTEFVVANGAAATPITAVSDWNFAAPGQGSPNLVSEQFTNPADISNYQGFVNAPDIMIWHDELSWSAFEAALGALLRTPFPSVGPALTAPYPFSFTVGVVAAGAGFRGAVRPANGIHGRIAPAVNALLQAEVLGLPPQTLPRSVGAGSALRGTRRR